MRVDVAHAIQQEHVGLRTRARHIEAPALGASRRRQHARGDQSQVQILPGVQRQARDLCAVHHVAQRAAIGFQQRRRRVDFHHLQNAAYLQSQINVRDLVHLYQNVLLGHLLKAWDLQNKRILRGSQLQKLKAPIAVADSFRLGICGQTRKRQFRAGNRRPALILYEPGNASGRGS